MKRITASVLVVLALIGGPGALTQGAEARGGKCGRYSGRAYVICKESGPEHMPNGLPPGRRHGRKSTASGPCGMLAQSRRDYGGDSLAACGRYMRARYGTWDRAARHHARVNWW